ncbi:hypothetical protein GCM10023347_07710 [Streptomyces chumphonensis]|uniref:Uncharacterized protein n=1 Tax=Streptomyces chumphonensis TaxID=1214925 RepID=A0A927F3G4_9ACTN|nr:hypothetical protein [Streptomyces chumphonensis]MBD3934839.1 hypothetical protein [Streptomyces chumphonensis]
MATTTLTPTTTVQPATTGRSRRRRARIERIAYIVAAPGLAIGPQLDAAWPAHLTAAATGTLTLAWLYHKARPAERQRLRREKERLELATDHRLELLRACYRATPALTGSALYLGLLAAGAAGIGVEPLVQYGAPSLWAAVMAAALPRTRAPRRKRRSPAEMLAELEHAAGLPHSTDGQDQEQDTGQERRLPAPRTYAELVAWHWETSEAAKGCHLGHVQQLAPGRPDFRAVLVAPRGKAVPQLTPAALAAVWDLPEGTVSIEPMPGHGPGHKLITARPTLDLDSQISGDSTSGGRIDPDLAALWRSRLAKPGGPLDGVHLLETKIEANRIALRVRAADDQVLRLPHQGIARALDIDDMELVVCQTNRMGDGIISVYETHPLLTIREATARDLTMNERGEIAFGLQHDGRPARINLYKPGLGATNDLFVGAPGAGKSVALNTLLIAERINGVVSIVADAQDGMSLPEANGRVAHFGSGIPAVAAALAAAYAVAKYRQKISSANGWGSFTINDPWRLVVITLDELNLILAEEAEADIPPAFKTWVLGLISKFQITGRKMGVGIRFAAQGIHSADLGDKVKLRANAKTGAVWLGRTTSGTTSHMATEGILPPGVDLVPIPETFGGDDIEAAFRGEETPPGPTTAGMANLIRQGRLTRMRVWRAAKDANKQYTGLIDLYESAPIPYLTPEEQAVFDAEHARALAHAEKLLAGDDQDDDTGDIDDGLDELLGTASTAAEPPTVQNRILNLLTEHGSMKLRDIQEHLDDVQPATVSNTASQLCRTGQLHRAGRGIYTLPQ